MKTRKSKFLIYAATLLLFAGSMTMCSEDDATTPVDKVAFEAAITAAQTLHDGAKEGVAASNYLKGSKAELQTAINAAKTVAADVTTTQEQVTAATASLASAVATFQGKLVTAIDSANLVGQWTFDEITATAANTVVKDYSGNSRDGQIKVGHPLTGAGNGVIALAPDRYGIAGKALRFDNGSNVEIPYSTALNPPQISISLWANPTVTTTIWADNYMVSLNRWNGYKFQTQSTPRLFFTVTYDDPTADPPKVKACCFDRDQDVGTIERGVWHHYVVTFGDGKMAFYIDGFLTKTWTNTPGTLSTLATPVNLVIGQSLPTGIFVAAGAGGPYENYGGDYYKGDLDEVRIYKSVLTAAQVNSIYNLEKP